MTAAHPWVGFHRIYNQDGTSNSILIGERAYENGFVRPTAHNWLKTQKPAGGLVYFSRGTGFDYDPSADPEASSYNRHRGISDVCFTSKAPINEFHSWHKKFGASSQHPAGVNMGFADGSTRFVKETIDHSGGGNQNSVYEQLMAINDGRVIDANAF